MGCISLVRSGTLSKSEDPIWADSDCSFPALSGWIPFPSVSSLSLDDAVRISDMNQRMVLERGG